jgi:hypothetical protein
MIFTLLGLAIGATSLGPLSNADKETAQNLGLGALIWLGVTAIISTWVGSWVAGRFSGGPRATDGMLHGLVTWASATLLTAFLLTSAAGALLGGTAKLLGQTMSGAGKAAGQMASSDTQGQGFGEQARNMIPGLTPTGRTGEGQGNDLMSQARNNPQLLAVVTRMMAKGGASADPQDRQEAINIMTSSGMSQQEAANTVDRWDQQYQQTRQTTKEKAQQAGETAVKGTAYGAWSAFILLILCGAAGAFGGYLGSRALPYIRAEEQATA